MAFTNSSLVSYTKISPNRTPNRNHAIDTITIHCVVGQCSVQTLGEVFAPTSRQASSNYGVGYDGKIGMYVEEKDRSWCSSNAENDHRAVTIEVASDTTEPHAVNDKAYAAMLDLVTDICKRNGIKKLVWSTNKNDRVNHLNGCNMTVHRDYANKSCPGTYLYERHGEIAAEVNKRLAADDSGSQGGTSTEGSTDGSSNNLYRVRKTWEDSKTQKGAYKILENAKKCADANPGYSVFDVNGVNIYTPKTTTSETASAEPFLVKVTITNLNIRKGPGTNYATTGQYTGIGVFTIVEESNGQGSDKGWGRLKSGAGWISLDYCTRV